MDKIYEILDSISATSSLLKKQEILAKNKTNEILKQVFFLAENPAVKFYIRFTEDEMNALPKAGKAVLTTNVLDSLANLYDRKVTGHAARDFLVDQMTPLCEESRSVLSRIINRDLRCNAGTSLTNKTWPKLIPEMPQMLASKFDQKAIQYAQKNEGKNAFIVQRKCDGGRVITYVLDDGSVEHYSRSGNKLDLHGVFDAQLSKYPGRVFDGEVLVRSKTGVEDRKTGNGYYTKAVRGTLSPAEAIKFSYVVWDVIPLDQYNDDGCPETYQNRLLNLHDCSKTWDKSRISVVEGRVVSTLHEAEAFYMEMLAKGEEGAILKLVNAPWENKRSKNQIKMKEEKTADLRVVEVEKGTGKFANKMGALICESECGNIRVSVGSGFKDDERDLSIKYVGRIVELKYNALITAKGRETSSMFLPIFQKVRDDKRQANSLDELV